VTRPQRLRGSTRIERRRPFRPAAKTLLVFCEGAVTERQYVYGLAKYLGAGSVSVSLERGDPKRLVEFAVAEKRAGRRRGSDAADLVWCLFDADDHTRLAEALVQARDNELSVALSNPSFELWLLLHFADQTAYIDRHDARREVENHVPRYSDRKEVPFELLIPGHSEAALRAELLEKRHRDNGSPTTENPSSGVWRFVAEVASLRTAP
jgi:RloB-like protein